MSLNNDLRKNTGDRGFLFFSDTPVVYHCHHFNLFLDQTIDDALGAVDGEQLRMKASREASHQLIANVVAQVGAELPSEKLEIAANLFRHMGHGRLELLADADGGDATGEYLHYSHSWQEKYGKTVKRQHPLDAFAAGFACAAIEVAFGISRESVGADEQRCRGLKDPACKFKLAPTAPPEKVPAFVDQEAYLRPSQNVESIHEEQVVAIANGLRDFTKAVSGDERGLVQAFGVLSPCICPLITTTSLTKLKTFWPKGPPMFWGFTGISSGNRATFACLIPLAVFWFHRSGKALWGGPPGIGSNCWFIAWPWDVPWGLVSGPSKNLWKMNAWFW